MNKYANTLKDTLSSQIGKMAKKPTLFVKKPGKDFTRNRKLPFETVIKLLISMGGNSIYKELLESQGYNVSTATSSAFVQQRDKMLPTAFEHLNREFILSFSDAKTYRGYRLFAVDGSDLHIPTNPDDADSFYQCNPETTGYNLLNLNAMYDLCNRFYIDNLIQASRQKNENRALVEMVKRSDIKGKVIVIADRNYESYNSFAHIERKGWNYVIRVKDSGKAGILSALPLPHDDEYDVCFNRVLTRKYTNEIKAHPEIYRFISSTSTFDFLDQENKFYHMTFRVVRFKIAEDCYETVITNLDSADFPPQEIKELYHMRWSIESSFRELKYAVGLLSFHSKKREHIEQEVFARIIMYNFAEMITAHAVVSKGLRKHAYQVNFTIAIHICRQFLRVCFWNNAHPPDVEALIHKNILPVRPGRKYKRKMRYKPAVSFLYRVA